jgi:hypothetical protein
MRGPCADHGAADLAGHVSQSFECGDQAPRPQGNRHGWIEMRAATGAKTVTRTTSAAPVAEGIAEQRNRHVALAEPLVEVVDLATGKTFVCTEGLISRFVRQTGEHRNHCAAAAAKSISINSCPQLWY